MRETAIIMHSNSPGLLSTEDDRAKINSQQIVKDVVTIDINLDLKLLIIEDQSLFRFNPYHLDADSSLTNQLLKLALLERVLNFAIDETGIVVETIKEPSIGVPYIEEIIIQNCQNYMKVSLKEGEYDGIKTLLFTISGINDKGYELVLGKFFYYLHYDISDKIFDLKRQSADKLFARLVLIYSEPGNDIIKRKIRFDLLPVYFP